MRIAKALFGKVCDDLAAMEDIPRESGLDRTIPRPPGLTGKPLTGPYRTAGRNVRGRWFVPRAGAVRAADHGGVRVPVARPVPVPRSRTC
ncbi:MAG TPA: hypothetical protein VIV12_15615 [Streptosporangiaceae bacterium]